MLEIISASIFYIRGLNSKMEISSKKDIASILVVPTLLLQALGQSVHPSD